MSKRYFTNRYSQMTGDSADDITDVRMRKSLRLNPLRNDPKNTIARLEQRGVSLEKIPWLPFGYWYTAPFSLGAQEEYLLGYYYLQEAASQLPVQALLNTFERTKTKLADATILDMAAAPGSKTTQLAAAMNNEGTIIALEADVRRGESLANNLERCGVTNTFAYHKDAQFASDLKLEFDAVMLDAPCSGNFAGDRKWFSKRTQHDPSQRAQMQRSLLKEALHVTKPGGIIVYSTCSLEVEENEEVLTAVLADAGARIIDSGLSIGSPALTRFDNKTFREDLRFAKRLWPHRDGTQGFFVAVIQIGNS